MANAAAVTVRIPAELKRRLCLRAHQEHRSLSSEITAVLERSVAQEPVRGSSGHLLGLYRGRMIPSEEDFVEVRALLWSGLSKRKARRGT